MNIKKYVQPNARKFVGLMIVLGVLIGTIAAYTVVQDEKECRALEEDLREGQTFDGTVSCYPPDALEARVSEDLDQRTETQCVCRIVQNDNIRYYPIVTS